MGGKIQPCGEHIVFDGLVLADLWLAEDFMCDHKYVLKSCFGLKKPLPVRLWCGEYPRVIASRDVAGVRKKGRL